MLHDRLAFSADIYKARRESLMSKFSDGLIWLQGNGESSINFKDNWYPFRQDSSFLYYTGLDLPDLNVVLDVSNGQTILFGDDASIDMIVWTGPQTSIADLAALSGIEKYKTSGELAQDLNSQVLYLPPYRGDHTVMIRRLLGVQTLEPSLGLIHAIVAQRNIKTTAEIMELHKAVGLTAKMHHAVMQAAKPGMKEYELVGVASQFAWNNNARFSFPPILTKNGETLHNHYHGHTIQDGDLVLFDGGIEVTSGYCGDMTRTFPVSEKFSSEQKELYQIVVNSLNGARDLCSIGTTFKDIHLHASKILVEGLTEMGIMKGNADEAVQSGAHTMFFQCGLGHMMGMDVHDMENLGEQHVGYGAGETKSKEFGLKSLRLGRKLEEGFVFTIEPGIYIIPALIDMMKSKGQHLDFINYDKLENFRNFGGIRIENDYVMQDGACVLLGDPLIYETSEVENLRTHANT